MLRRATMVGGTVAGRGLVAGVIALMGCLLWASPGLAAFGFTSFDFTANEAPPPAEPTVLGSPDVTAGSHPFSATTSFGVNTVLDAAEEPVPDGDLKDVGVELPRGLVGDPQVVPQCPIKAFHTERVGTLDHASCPDSTQIGTAVAEISPFGGPPLPVTLPLYNLVAPPNAPAQFGFNPVGFAVTLTPTLRPNGDYGITIVSKNTEQALRVYGVKATLWGVPADESHDVLRGLCLGILGEPEGTKCPVDTPRKPFLTMPGAASYCREPLFSAVLYADSWQAPGPVTADGTPVFGDPRWQKAESASATELAGCGGLDFRPSLALVPDNSQADSPSGLEARLHLPQSENPGGLGEADLKKIEVSLPPGFTVSPSSADGLGACTPEEIDLASGNAPTCPGNSKVGTVEIDTPLLEAPLEGSVYVAQQENNPFKSLIALYIVAEGPGVVIKLPGEVALDKETGQVTTRFDNNPQLPFEDLKLKFFGGPRAALSTPSTCGSFEARNALTPWSTEEPQAVGSPPLSVSSNCNRGFDPAFIAGTGNNQAGGFGPLSVTLSRSDQDQFLGGVSVTTPPGLLGMLSQVPLCGVPQAAAGTCPAASRIAHVTVGAGPGSDPVWVSGEAFLTGPYGGGPFGLSIVVPVKAGPFDLGDEVVRAAIFVDPHTAQITIVSNPLPQINHGIPLQIRTINVTADREGFIFNPTNCEPLAVTGTITSTQNTSAAVSSGFQAVNCAKLPFAPKFAVSSVGKTSRRDGASLDVKIGYPKGTQANIRKVAVSLPKQLPSRLSTIQKACPEATFAANPASCPAASNIGSAKATTPVLNVPLSGPAYLVSHGGAAFPDLVMVLQGQGVTLDVVGSINISKAGITSSAFNAVPDAPIGSFELKLPVGPQSALTANLPKKANHSLCGRKLVMPTTITGQNGAVVKQSTKLAITGCSKKPRAHTGKGNGKGKKRK